MAKRFTKLLAVLAMLIFMAPSMVMWGQTRSEVVAYTLQPASGSNNSYTGNCDITIDGITWNLTGNSQQIPWRIGGKNLTNVDRPLYSKTAISDNISKIEVTHGSANNITVNSWTVIVASDVSFDNVVSTLTPDFEVEKTTTINRPDGVDWTNCYYKFVYNVSVSGNTNRFIQFTQAAFYKEEGSVSAPSITAENVEIEYDDEEGEIEYTISNPVEGGVLTANTDAEWLTIGTVGETVPFTSTVNDDGEREATITLTYTYNTDQTVTKNVTVTQANNPNAPGTENNPYTVAQARAAIDAGTGTQGVYATGIVSAIPTAYNPTYSNVTFNMVDEEGDEVFLQAYRCGGEEAANVAIGDVVVVYGNLIKYGSTYEFGQDCQLVSLTHHLVPSVTVTPTAVNFAATDPAGFQMVNLTIAYENIEVTNYQSFTVQCYDNQGNETEMFTWLVAGVTGSNDEGYVVRCVAGNNDGAARTAYFKVYAYDAENNKVYSELVTVTQAEYVAPTYAELPFAFNSGKAAIAGTDGLYQEGLGSDYNTDNTKLRFDHTGDWLLLQFQERPGTLTFDIKGNSFSEGTFKVQTSEDGVTYTDLETYTEISGTQSEEFTDLGENVRYVKWIYTNKSSGNVGLGNITLAEYVEPVIVASITVTPDVVNVNAEEHDGTLTLAYENLTIAEMSDFDIQYYNAEGQEAETPDWIVVLVAEQDPQIGEGYVVSYYMLENEGEARTAYFKVYAMDDETNLVYSNLVTVTQAAPVLDYAVLPFVWAGGSKADFLALNGVTAQGLGSDYASGNAPYLIRFDNTGDYIQVKCDQQPGKVTIGVKMIGGGETSTITIQGSADGETFTNIETLTISGAQGDELTLETINAFADADRYVRMLFTKGSNVGVGPITIAKGSAPSIAVTPATLDLEATGTGQNGVQVQQFGVTYHNLNIESNSDFSVQFYDAEGEEQEQPTWILPNPAYVAGGNEEGYIVVLFIEGNTDVARSAYFKVSALDADENVVYSNLVTINQAGALQQYTLTVEPFENLDLITFVNDEMVMEGNGEIQVNEGDEIMLSVVALEGYEMETLIVNGVDHVNDIADDFTYTFTMPAENVTISATAVEYVPPTGDEYALYTGGLVEGDYLIVYDGGAMNTTVESDRLQFEVVTATNNVIVTDNAAIVWHIAKSGEYWTIYNADADAYAASTGVKNKAQMLADGTDDKALWTVSGTETYEFVNKHNAANSVNANLRKNGTYGFACYATSTGGALSLYKKVTPVTQPLSLSEGENWVSFYVKTTLDDLKDALLNALGDDATNIKITSQSNGYTYWDGSTWRGTLNPFDVSQMFVIEVTDACEISLEAMPVNPARPITIVNGTNWIGFPFSGNMSLSNAFSGFAENGDKILAPNGSFATYNGDNWEGELELRPGQGYKYEVTTTGERNLVFPSSK